MSNKKLIVISSNFPSPSNPAYGTFVQQIVHAFANQGAECHVIAPVAWHRAIKGGYPSVSEEFTSKARKVKVFRPRFISFSARESFAKLGFINPSRWTFINFHRSVKATIKKNDLSADVLYGHFMFSAGACAVKIGNERGIPGFIGVGEGEFWTIAKMGEQYARKTLSKSTGFITNSSDLKKKLIEFLGDKQVPIDVFPNGVELDKFKPLDKNKCREEHGLPRDKFIVGSLGNYTHNKGISRVAEAIRDLAGVVGAFAGSGSEPPLGENVVFSCRIPHQQVPSFLSALDVFVLPTLVEGCSNAIIEAMACGLPIISSDYSFNRDILDDLMSFQVDPMNIEEIRSRVTQLQYNDKLRSSMAENARSRSQKFDIDQRAVRILGFMESVHKGI